MKLRRKSLLVRWAYWDATEDDPIPTHTDICTVIWNAVFAVILCIGVISALLFFLFIAIVVAFNTFPYCLIAIPIFWLASRKSITAAFEDFKNRTCTRIEIVDDEKEGV